MWQNAWNIVCQGSYRRLQYPRILLGAGHVGTFAYRVSKFQTPRGNVGFHDKPHCLYILGRASHSYCTLAGYRVGTILKSRWLICKQIFQRITFRPTWPNNSFLYIIFLPFFPTCHAFLGLPWMCTSPFILSAKDSWRAWGLLESLWSLRSPLGMCAGFQSSRDVRTYLWPWWLSHFQILLVEFLTSLTVLCSPRWDCNLGSDRKKGFSLLFPTELLLLQRIPLNTSVFALCPNQCSFFQAKLQLFLASSSW